ncbi:hypothetical protein JMM61_01470 [Rhodovulum sulfidophilum]|uniref:hypothetical protein n=1 Tax=Rhodovulum sulfidophilum TaxID=35806 RepID=UPI0019275FE0|nr:hypothetical protein [Rhodovulum sulfidophilum]MBL3584046.1 hypothetical protein [Rhodovulum sulfidophilum]
MDAENQERLRAYCAILDVRESSTEPNPALALQILARMYLVPTIEDHGERNRALNEIRGNLRGEFDAWSPFATETARVAAMMQELPNWFNHLNESTEALVERYKSLSTAIRILQYLGVGATGSAIAAGLAEGSKQNSVRAGVERGARRAAGQGPLLEEVQRRARIRMTPARAGIVGAAIIIGGTLAYHNALEQQEQIREIIMHRFQEGEVTDAQFRDVFGDRIDPANLKKYWEL